MRAKVTGDAEDLRKFAAGQKLRGFRAPDCVAELKEGLLEIGQNLFGPRVGRNDGPLITFLLLALQPVLGDATPDTERFGPSLEDVPRPEGGGHPSRAVTPLVSTVDTPP